MTDATRTWRSQPSTCPSMSGRPTMSRREFATDFAAYVNDGESEYRFGSEPQSTKRAFTPMQALMEAAPGEAIEPSQMEMLALRDLLSDAIDDLPVRHKWVLEQNLIHRIPVRTLGAWMGLGKSYVWVLKQEALAMLRTSLQDHPSIVAYLGRHDIENEEE
jgi:DNA-directed RNA polymerase specialized sigma24 family protein